MPSDAPANYRFVLRLQIIDGLIKMAAANFPENRAPSAWEMAAMKAIADASTDCEPYGKLTSIFDIPVDEKIVKQAAAK
ncbi:hypothetical protein LB524_18190 [Mesorhizobium sp. ESP6-5]|uniref:hypothetical protein n=1 Tax=Mesorhizobium sp. ESP6-5 TaxID=2876623 RepID=UPI001CCDE4C1|nr:hypothetical protein [Mesorhizobium sp. ESP6-5]MBZ9757220.1 hypothetical protein [Mesorhizobium sp. ESP6-5]